MTSWLIVSGHIQVGYRMKAQMGQMFSIIAHSQSAAITPE